MKTPAIELLATVVNPDFTMAEVVISKCAGGYDILHVTDRERVDLEVIPLAKAREVAQLTSTGAFRPLKSAPNLKSGWMVRVRDEEELEYALNQIYPGAVADWYADRIGNLRVTNYREFTNRQTGMYRIAQSLGDEAAAEVITACCDARFCLKRRLWSVESLAPDATEGKSRIPCCEPCAVFLEFARATARMRQEENLEIRFSPSEVETLRCAVESQLAQLDAPGREGDIKRPDNPRRLLLLLRKLPSKPSGPID